MSFALASERGCSSQGPCLLAGTELKTINDFLFQSQIDNINLFKVERATCWLPSETDGVPRWLAHSLLSEVARTRPSLKPEEAKVSHTVAAPAGQGLR